MDIFESILDALETEARVMVATIISTTGSTPASALSKMLIRNAGTVSIGTVGGGCLEADVLEAAKRLAAVNKADILTFHLNEDEFVQGLICGGNLDVMIEPISRSQRELIEQIRTARNAGEDCIVATLLGEDGSIQRKEVLEGKQSDGISHGLQVLTIEEKKTLAEELHVVLHRNETRRLKTRRGQLILEPIQGTPRLVIFGGGHVSRSVSKAATLAGFQVTVVDDRKEYANTDRFPEARQTIVTDFERAFETIIVKDSTYLVIVTRGHRFDEDLLERALAGSSKYIGMIGSKRKVLTAYKHLRERGATDEKLNRVYAPIGLEIGAITAEEIGISVVAELIAVRRGEKGRIATNPAPLS